ncbi:MAG: neutral/alkaline non-lysosomal ceramidase N-terminal domain-containing protein [Candidatus Omnitrophota bacterium]|nr:neutral/alkaline non-lysosomal ceramidase N-terminal domain-containing protein [Candidatus Omnitrophota bacterium]
MALALAGSALAGCASPRLSGNPQQQIHRSGPASLTAGVGKVEITPPKGTPLAGYSRRKSKPAQGVRDPLYVRAITLSDGEDTVLLVSADLLIFPPPLVEKLVRRISSEWNLPRQALILTATHTHSGPGAVARGLLYPIVFGRYNRQRERALIAQTLEAVEQAMKNRRPVRWGFKSSEEFLGELIENRMVPGTPVDSGLRVLMLEGMNGRPLAMVVSASAHPTLLSSKEMRFSGDYPGALTRKVETLYPGSTCLFVNGTAGDSRPIKRALGRSNDEAVDRFGETLAEGTTGLINQMHLQPKADLAVWGGWFRLPPPRIRLGWLRLHPFLGRRILPSASYLNLAALDRTLLVPLEAEMTADLGSRLRTQLSALGFQPLLLGYANGYLGYAVTSDQYRQMGYEVGMSWYGPFGGEKLVEEICRLASLLI